MTPPIERVRYYDGEYLRAFDFTADQAYHVDMRRRLNMALHLYGIVEGLQLQDTSSSGISQVSITAGMAIDPFGREIFLLAPYTFDDVADVNANRITVSQIYEVWIQYVRVADTPPSVGYAACDTTAQNTRWLETFKIVLLNKATPTNPPPPQVTDDISEDETPDPDTSNGVFLGLIYAAPGSTTGVFSLKDASGSAILQPPLTYVGLCAQNIQPPDYSASNPPAFDVTKQNGPYGPPLSVELLSTLFCDQNLIVGPDFAVSTPKPTPQAPFPAPKGNLKVASDFFLQGNLYMLQTAGCLSLGTYIKSLLPDVQTGQVQLTPSGTTDPLLAQSGAIPITSALSLIDPGRIRLVVFISQMELDFSTFTNAQLNNLSVQVSGTATYVAGSGNGCQLNLVATVDPSIAVGGGAPNSTPWKSVTAAYTVTFYPLV